jgi:hypothetical protein
MGFYIFMCMVINVPLHVFVLYEVVVVIPG